jgi:hypothetical protein
MLKDVSKIFSKMFNYLFNDSLSYSENEDDLIILNSDEQKNKTVPTSTLLLSSTPIYLFLTFSVINSTKLNMKKAMR